MESFIESVINSLPTSPNQFEIYKKAQASDAVCPNRENHLLNNLNRIKLLLDLKLKQLCETVQPKRGDVAVVTVNCSIFISLSDV